MGVIVHKEQERNTELSRKIAADLKIKAEQSASSPDLVDESDYLANSKTTGRYSWFWLILVGTRHPRSSINCHNLIFRTLF